MNKFRAFILLILVALASPMAWGQAAATRTRRAASLPSTCSPGGPSTPAETIIVNNVSYACAATNLWKPIQGLEADNTWTNNNRFCGPIPWADVSCFGAHAPAGGVPSTTALCVKGNPQIVVADPNRFQINDGVTIYGCGASNNMVTPADLQVTPSEPWGLADTRSPVSGPAGNSPYEYTVVARDIYGGLTAPATPAEIKTGQASLGLQRAAIRTLTRKEDRITVVTTEPNRLVLGALVELEPKNSQQFGGWYNVAKVDSATQFELWTTPTDTRGQGWMVGDTVSYSGGGTVAYYQENYLRWSVVPGAWEYYVCAKRPGEDSLKLIGVTKPTGLKNHYIDVGFEDYGSPYMDGQVFPSYVTNAICTGAATNDPLSTWITSIASDGVTYTLHDAPSQTASKKTLVFDDAPGILRALNSTAYFNTEHNESTSYLGGAIFIPPARNAYVINSYLPVPMQVTIWQSGKLNLNETVSLAAGDNWFGDWSSEGSPQFGGYSGASVSVNAASPGIYLMGTGNSFRGLTIGDYNGSGGTLLVADNASPSNFDYVNFLTGAGGGPKDYTGMAVILRDTTQTIANYHFNNTLISTGPDQVNDKSWTPSFWVAPAQAFGNNGIEVTMSRTTFNRRGIAWGGGHGGDTSVGGVANFESNWSYRQGGIIPYFTCMACSEYSPLTFNDASQDTEGQPLEAALIINPNSGYLGPRITALHPTGGVQSPLFSGLRPAFADVDAMFSKASAFQNRDILYKTGGGFAFVAAPYATTGNYVAAIGSLYTVGMPMHGIGGYSWWFDLAVPTNISGTAEPGGKVPVGSWLYTVSAVGADNGETIMATPSSPIHTSDGKQTVKLKWNPALGAYSYNVWRCEAKNACLSTEQTISAGNGPWFRVALHTASANFSDESASPTPYPPPMVTGTGSTIVNATGAYAPFFQAPPITVSQLPAAAPANAGQMRRVTDSTTVAAEGQPCAGGGADAALAFSNGKVWKCF
jgi:hypothetical protein